MKIILFIWAIMLPLTILSQNVNNDKAQQRVDVSQKTNINSIAIVSVSDTTKLKLLGEQNVQRCLYNGSEWERKTGKNISDGETIISFKGGYYQRILNEYVYLEWWNGKADGLYDNSQALKKAITLATKNGLTIKLKPGTYKLKKFTTETINKNLKIEGNNSILDFCSTKVDGNRIFKVNASIELDNITFQNGCWLLDPTKANNTEEIKIKITNCNFYNIYAPVQFDNIYQSKDVYPTSWFNIYVTACKLNNCRFGFAFNGTRNLNSFIFKENYVEGVEKLCGVRINEDNEYIQNTYNRANIIISDNVFKNLRGIGKGEESGDRGIMNAIAVFGYKVIVTNNIIENCSTERGIDGEAIYTKASYAIISNNVIKNNPDEEAAITVKGNLSKAINISNNIISKVLAGIQIAAQGGLVTVNNNFIDSVSTIGIRMFQSAVEKYTITENTICNSPLATTGILIYGYGNNHIASGNRIFNIGSISNKNTVAGIRIDAALPVDKKMKSFKYLEDLYVENNIIDKIQSSTNNSFGIYVYCRDDSLAIKNLNISSNHLSNIDKGIGINLSKGVSIEDVFLYTNTYKNITTEIFKNQNQKIKPLNEISINKATKENNTQKKIEENIFVFKYEAGSIKSKSTATQRLNIKDIDIDQFASAILKNPIEGLIITAQIVSKEKVNIYLQNITEQDINPMGDIIVKINP